MEINTQENKSLSKYYLGCLKMTRFGRIGAGSGRLCEGQGLGDFFFKPEHFPRPYNVFFYQE